MAIPRNVVAIAVLITLTASGCTQPDPNAKPTYACTPSDGGTARPCYKAEYDLQAKEDALYAEAEAVFRTFVAEDERIFRIGGAVKATPVIQETTTGDFQKAKLTAYQTLRSTRTRLTIGTFKVAWVERTPALRASGSEAAIQYCLDASTARLATRGEGSWPVGYISDVLQLVREAGGLKISAATEKAVDKC